MAMVSDVPRFCGLGREVQEEHLPAYLKGKDEAITLQILGSQGGKGGKAWENHCGENSML